MSPTVDLGVDFSDVQDMDKFPVVPNGAYQFIVKNAQEVQSGPNSKVPGRPMIKWSLEITDPDTGKPCNLFYNTVLPWTPPGQDELDTSGVGMLVAFCKAVGSPWTGQQFDTETYLGLGGTVNVKQKTRQVNVNGQWVDDPDGEQTNEIKDFEY